MFTQTFIIMSKWVFFVPHLTAGLRVKKAACLSKAWFIYKAPNHKFVPGGVEIMALYLQ